MVSILHKKLLFPILVAPQKRLCLASPLINFLRLLLNRLVIIGRDCSGKADTLALLPYDVFFAENLDNEDPIFLFHYRVRLEFQDAEKSEEIEIISSLVVTHIIVIEALNKH